MFLTDQQYELEELVDRDRQRAEEVAKAKNADIIEGDPYTLLVDVDEDGSLRTDVLQMIDEHFTILSMSTWQSHSGKGTHFRITVANWLSSIERVALQAALGSDGKREALAVLRIRQGIRTEPSLLFKPKGAEEQELNVGVYVKR